MGRCLFSTQGPSDGAAVADLVIRGNEMDLALYLELAADLPVQRRLVGFHRQEEVSRLLLELPKGALGIKQVRLVQHTLEIKFAKEL